MLGPRLRIGAIKYVEAALQPRHHESVAIWFRTYQEADVHIHFWPKDATPEEGFASKTIRTTAANDLTAVLRLSGLKPETTYRYEIILDGKPAPGADLNNLSFKTTPAPGTGGEIRFSEKAHLQKITTLAAKKKFALKSIIHAALTSETFLTK